MFTGLLKHTPPPATPAAAPAAASDQDSNAQTAVPTIPRGHLVVGSKDQLRLLAPVGSAATPNHCAAAGVHAMKHSGGAPRPPSSLSEEDDGGGGGRVKKKRKKKDRREWERGGVDVEEKDSSKPKKRKEERGPMVLTLRRSKEPKERRERRGKEPDQRNVVGAKAPAPVVVPEPAQVPVKVPGKRGRKPKIRVLPPETTNEGWRLFCTPADFSHFKSKCLTGNSVLCNFYY